MSSSDEFPVPLEDIRVVSKSPSQVGAGLLALGPAVAHAGWVGIPIIVLCACCAAHTSYLFGWIMLQTQAAVASSGSLSGYDHDSDEESSSSEGSAGSPDDTGSDSGDEEILQEQPFPSYENIGYQAIGTFGYFLSMLLQSLMLIGVCTIFLVLIGVNAAQVERILGIEGLSKRSVILVAAAFELIPCGLEMWVEGLYDQQMSVGILVRRYGRENLGPPCALFTWEGKSQQDVERFIIVIYVAVAAAGFSVGGVAMASRKVDSNVLVGLSGCPSDQVETVSWSLLLAYSAITLHVLLAFPVPFHTGAETLEAMLGTRSGALKPGLRGLIMRLPRLLFLGLCTVLAYTLPFFGALLDVVAAIAGQGTVFILPVVFSVAIQRQQGMRVPCYEWILDFLCLLVGTLGAVTGLYYGLQELAALC
ncbi:unnamed protein product [Symbiodinium sp. CCMP2456]|nr:unnamed protein product [Symbiodinium sp. CCMP2456]